MTPSQLAHIPYYGSGMGYRKQIKDKIIEAKEHIDCLEILTDQFIQSPQRISELAEMLEHFPIIAHGVSLSIGSATPPEKAYLDSIKHICEIVDSPYYSEHLCMTRSPGIDLGHLSPLWFNEDVLQQIIRNVNLVQDYLERPLVLENVTYMIDIPNAGMSQTEFFNCLVEATHCGVLLDVTNVFINSMNHEFNALDFLEAMPLDHVIHVHIAGGYWSRNKLIDGHSHPVQDETWQLLSELTQRAYIRGVILEHDDNFADMSMLVEQVVRARHYLQNALA